LRTNATPKHVPDLILQAPELPKTKSNKLVEIAVGDLINGRKVRNQDALINPESLAWFGNLDLNSLLY
jgi:acetoacetyl-CoA synthetase